MVDLPLRCPNCSAIIPRDHQPRQSARPEHPGVVARRLASEVPSPPGEYLFRGWRCRYDYARIWPHLGTIPDRILARVISAPRRRLAYLRRRMGLPTGRAASLALLDPLLGTMTDRALGRRLGLDNTDVAKRRRMLGIPPYRGSEHHRRDRLDAELRHFVEQLERARG